jgi:energy-coupling factor transporter ATP-binding protein EcfA2
MSGNDTFRAGASAADLVAEFRAKTIAHPILRRVDEEARQAITAPDSKNLVIIYGPTGVGKTTLIRRIARLLDEEIEADLRADTGRARVPIMSAVAPEGNSFHWKGQYGRELRAIDHPYAHEQLRALGHRPDADQLRTRTELALNILRPRAFIIDEAHHIGVGASQSQLIKQLEIIKSHASASGTLFVLVGTYSLLNFRNLNGQLSRRSRDIHFPRYRPIPEELLAFRETLIQLGDKLPIPSDDLSDLWDEIYERTAGCVGILKDWLTQGLALALQDPHPRLAWRHLGQTAMGVSAMKAIAEEIQAGEAATDEGDDERGQLRSMLGLPGDSVTTTPSPTVGSGARANSRPGIRRPGRDRVLAPEERTNAHV